MGQPSAKSNPEIAFCYVTAAGTNSSKQGRITLARVKGATENALMRLFKRSHMYRPSFMLASRGQKNVKYYYKCNAWLYPIRQTLCPTDFCTLQEVGLAMINAVSVGYPKQILDVNDIVKLAKA